MTLLVFIIQQYFVIKMFRIADIIMSNKHEMLKKSINETDLLSTLL